MLVPARDRRGGLAQFRSCVRRHRRAGVFHALASLPRATAVSPLSIRGCATSPSSQGGAPCAPRGGDARRDRPRARGESGRGGPVRARGRPVGVRGLRRLHLAVHGDVRAAWNHRRLPTIAYEFCEDEAPAPASAVRRGRVLPEQPRSPTRRRLVRTHRGRAGRTRGGSARLRCDGDARARSRARCGARGGGTVAGGRTEVRGSRCGGAQRRGERAERIAPFGPLFRRAKNGGLPSVPHAGEWAGPRNVETLEHYLPDRIGHGVRASEDPALVEHLAATGIPSRSRRSPTSRPASAPSRSIRSRRSATPESPSP